MLLHLFCVHFSSIRGTAEILKEGYQRGDKEYEFLEIQVKESERLNQVVEVFLRLSRPQRAIKGDCDIVMKINRIITLVYAEAKKRHITLEIISNHVPTVEGDPEKPRQAFLNSILVGLQAVP